MPIVKATIEGREYSFAPLLFGEIKRLRKAKLARQDLLDSFELWQPYIESSMKRAGNEMPDLESMEIQVADVALTALMRGVMEASGIVVPVPGEAQPVPATIGTTSSGS